jgi:alkanesulfonate monooxygenase SsuD/methylene tetrahydromethanopterin reductase-like flavin-dependent oxidoreductase (luciferase family)
VDSMQGLWSAGERAAVESRLGAAIVGSEATVKAGLEKLLDETGADELIVVTDTFEPRARSESYRRLAQIGREIELPGNWPTQRVATRHRSR